MLFARMRKQAHRLRFESVSLKMNLRRVRILLIIMIIMIIIIIIIIDTRITDSSKSF